MPRVAKWRAFNGCALGFNPIVGGDQFKVYVATPITSRSNFLTRDSHIRTGVNTVVSPLMAKAGPFIGISPLLICDFDLYWSQYYDFVSVPFDHLDDRYNPGIIAQKGHEVKVGQNFFLSTTLKMAYANVILVNMFDIEYFDMDDVWYSIELVTVIDDGFDYYNKLFLFYEYKPGWRAGGMLETFHIVNSGYHRDILNAAFMADKKLPLDMSLIWMVGYHMYNPDYDGIRIWTALLKEWDL